MHYRFILIFFISILSYFSFSQEFTVIGKVIDSAESRVLEGAHVFLLNSDDPENSRYDVTDRDGIFVFRNVIPRTYQLKVSYVGFSGRNREVKVEDSSLDIGSILLKAETQSLDELKVTGQVPAATVKGDTLQFNADAYKTNPDASAEDLVKKLPGVIVEDGKVEAQGEEVKKVLVDGREFFGNDPSTALKTLPAEVVEKIEIFDKLSDQAEFTGFDDGNSVKTMNIIMRPEKRNGTFGRVFGGYGTDERYTAGGNLNFFKDTRRISILGLSNNINEQNFAQEDLLGVMSSGGRSRGMPGSGGGRSMPGGGNQDFMIGPQDGNTVTHSAGVNYSDQWGEKIEITASYFFNKTHNTTNEYLTREYINAGDSNQLYNETSSSTTDNFNHRFNVRFKYDIDSFNSIIITPRLSLQANDYNSDVAGANFIHPAEILSNTLNTYDDESSGYNFSNDLLYRHAFRKKGRTVSLNIGTKLGNTSSTTFLKAENNYFGESSGKSDTIDQKGDYDSQGNTWSASLMYTEPIKEKSQVYINIRSSYTLNNSDKNTLDKDPLTGEYSIPDTLLSNRFENEYYKNSLGAGYRYNNDKMFLTAGISVQRSDLTSKTIFPAESEIVQTFTNLLPNAMLNYKFSRISNLRVHYRTSTNEPSVTQLQNVVDNSNPLSFSTGNPDLKQEYTNTLMGRYSLTRIMRSKFFFVMLFVRNTVNYIGSSTFTAERDTMITEGVILYRGSQLTRPVNLDGYWNGRTFITYGLPVNKIKTNINLNTGISYARTPGIINGDKNFSNTWGLTQGIVFASNISEKIDFTISYNATYNIVENTIQEQLDNNYFYHNAGLDFTWIIWKGLVVRNELNQRLYRGLSENLDDDYLLWNASIGWKFLKNQSAEISLAVYDILDQNKSISRNVTETYIEDSTTEVLQRYFMITFTYNLKNFVQDENKSMEGPGFGPGGRPPFGNPGGGPPHDRMP